MAINSMKDVLSSGIKKRVKTVNDKNYVSFEIYFGTDDKGNKVRANKPSLELAKAYVREYFAAFKKPSLRLLTPQEVADARNAIEILISAGRVMTLTECAKECVKLNGTEYANVNTLVREAFQQYYRSLENHSEAHRKCVMQRVSPFVIRHYNDRIFCITAKNVHDYMTSPALKNKAVKTRNNILGYIKGFLSWCAKPEIGLMDKNPSEFMKGEIERYDDPKFITVEDMEKLVREVAKKHSFALPYLVLSYWCGIRTEEIARLAETPEDIKWEEGSIRIARPKGFTRGMRPRIVNLEECASAWMEYCNIRESINVFPVEHMRRAVYKAARSVRVKIGHNYGRHSFITYFAAKTGNQSMTESMAGTSSGMRSKHYDGLATRDAGERYFSIMP